MKIAFLTLFVIGVAAASNSVVLVFAPVPKIPALENIEYDSFNAIVKPLAEDHMIAVIQEDGLSYNDFLCKSNRTKEQSCYSHLQGITPKTFYRSVTNPEKVLQSLDPKSETIIISKSGKLETPLKCKAGKVVFLRFEEEPELSREDILETHDFAISNLMKQVSCATVFMYTSTPEKESTVIKRSRRALSVGETAAPEGGIIFSDPKFQIFYTKLAVNIDSTAKDITISSMKIDEHNTTDFTVTLTSSDGADTVTFDIALKKGYYYMKQLTYNKDTQFRTSDVNAPPAFSYFCGNLTVYSSNGNKLLWNSLQFQAPFSSKVNAVGNYFQFGDSWNCVGFVSHAILAGLFVSAILLAILFVGICWMMDINTMDRFDDPKGKTITINASE